MYVDSSSDNDDLDNSEDLGSLSEFDDSDTSIGIKLHGRVNEVKVEKVKEEENTSSDTVGDLLASRKKKRTMILMILNRFWKRLSRALLRNVCLTSL